MTKKKIVFYFEHLEDPRGFSLGIRLVYNILYTQPYLYIILQQKINKIVMLTYCLSYFSTKFDSLGIFLFCIFVFKKEN